MNKLAAIITGIEQHESLFLIDLDASGISLAMLLFDLKPVFTIGSRVNVLFKESEVALSKELSDEISFSNRFPATIMAINPGCILADISLQCSAGRLASIITMKSAKRLGLTENTEVTVLIKASQLSLEGGDDD
jgi:molybdate transport system regulatory protein